MLTEELNNVHAELQLLETELEKINSVGSTSKYKSEYICTMLNQFSMLFEIADRAEKKSLINILVDKVIMNEKFEITEIIFKSKECFKVMEIDSLIA